MANEVVKIKDSKTGNIINVTKTESGYTKGNKPVTLSPTQKEYTPGTPVKTVVKKSGLQNKGYISPIMAKCGSYRHSGKK